MNRRTFLATSAATVLGSMVDCTRSFAAAGSLSVRGTAGGPLVTPKDQAFIYCENRIPSKVPSVIYIDGLVNTSKRYSIDDLAKVPSAKKIITMECYANTAGGPLIYNVPLEGASLPALLKRAGLKPEAKAARVECIDGHSAFILPLTELLRNESMLVEKFGGAMLPMSRGAPFTRVFIPGAGGNHHPKWVTRITLIDEIAAEHPAPPMAGFLKPSPPEAIGSMAGTILIGYAFSGGGERVGRVEFSTDNGTTYQSMPLPPQPDPYIWLTWAVTWHPPSRGFYVLRVKATSAGGREQDTPGVIGIEVR